MRDIWICDTTGRKLEGESYCGLSDDVWSSLYETVTNHPDLEILPGLWQEQWGPEGDALLASQELGALSQDLVTLEPLLSEADSNPAVKELFACLSALCERAARRGNCLRFIAD